jgi:putative tryptophan/tyrosine transport system substrate-binding protein
MKRREFIVGLGSAAAWPVVTRAQQRDRVRKVSVLLSFAEDDPEVPPRLAALRRELERLGWSEGRNLRIDIRYAGARADQFPILAKQLIALQPDVILAISGPIALALQRETRTIPIVFSGASDPVGMGLVESLPRPGGNITGLLLLEASITGNWLATLHEIAPRLTRMALVGNPKTMPYDYYLRAAEVLAPRLAIELVPLRVETAADHERAFESFARMPNGGLALPPDSTGTLHLKLIIELAARYKLPAVYSNRRFVAAGGLMSYGIDTLDQFRQASTHIDRILHGEKPVDLPVQAPVKYETVLNLKTAKALGLTIPETLLATADEVIQ